MSNGEGRARPNNRYWHPRITLGELLLFVGLMAGLFHFGLTERDRESGIKSKLAVLAVEVEGLQDDVDELKEWVRRLGDKIDNKLRVGLDAPIGR